MRRPSGWLSIGLAAILGCGGNPPAATETEAQGAARVFAVARELEKGQKTKQAINAYNQLVRSYPNSPEAKIAAERIAKAQRDAVQRAAVRKRK